MEIPADMKVNGEPFFHIVAREGTPDLHIRMLEFYARHALVDRVIFNGADIDIDAGELSAKLANEAIEKLEKVLVIDAQEDVTEVILSDEIGA